MIIPLSEQALDGHSERNWYLQGMSQQLMQGVTRPRHDSHTQLFNYIIIIPLLNDSAQVFFNQGSMNQSGMLYRVNPALMISHPGGGHTHGGYGGPHGTHVPILSILLYTEAFQNIFIQKFTQRVTQRVLRNLCST